MLQGSIVALITPFHNGAVDEKGFQDFVDWQIGQGTHGLVPCGTTGESPTLSHAEHKRVVELCVEAAKKRVPVVAGTGSNSTEEAIDFTRHAKKAGADAALVVCPYYNRPTQEGLYQHFKAIHDAAELPIIIYNIPIRTAVDMSVATMARLAQLPNIVGVKDATNDLGRPLRTRQVIGADFCMLSGEDVTALAFNAPRACADMQEAWLKGDTGRAMKINDRLAALHDALFVETSPAPVKYAVSLLGKATPEVRRPLVAATPDAQGKLQQAMRAAGLLN